MESSNLKIEYGEDYIAYQSERSSLRKFIRKIYLNNILKYVTGAALDFGSGAGELLMKLPAESLGLEINEAAVRYCRDKKLNVELNNPEKDKYELNDIKVGQYKTFIISHVLEHFDNPVEVFHSLLKACNRLEIKRVIAVVPCIKGFNFDKTHRTFIEKDFFANKFISEEGFKIYKQTYFPFNFKFVGYFFTYNELVLILDKITI